MGLYNIKQGANKTFHIGLVVGGGSGRLLAQVFHDFINHVVTEFMKGTRVHWYIYNENEYIFNPGISKNYDIINDLSDNSIISSHALIKQRAKESLSNSISYDMDMAMNIKEISIKEANDLFKWYAKLKKRGVKTVFRTSINAEALYLVRKEVKAYKCILLKNDDFILPSENKRNFGQILLIRDQSQGYYTNDDYTILNPNTTNEKIVFTGHYAKQNIHDLVEFSEKMAKKYFGKQNYITWASYKHHILTNVIENWFNKIDPKITLYQPDTGFTKLMEYLKGLSLQNQNIENIVFLTSNEIGDLIYEPFIEILKNGKEKLDLYSESYFMEKPFLGEFCEYQTVHGSADDLSGALGEKIPSLESESSAKIKPYATLRVAATIVAKYLEISGFEEIVEQAISKTRVFYAERSVKYSLLEVYEYFWEELKLSRKRPDTTLPHKKKTALHKKKTPAINWG